MSLYWTLALIVTLLHCLTGIPIEKSTKNPIDVHFDHINLIIKDLESQVCNDTTSLFYTPSTDTECIIKSLDCSIKEMNVIGTECFKKNDNNTLAIYRTKSMIELMMEEKEIKLPEEFESCFCGNKLEEKPYKEFLGNLRILLQKLYSSFSK